MNAPVLDHPTVPFRLFRAAKPYLAMSDDEEDVKRVVRSEKEKRYGDLASISLNEQFYCLSDTKKSKRLSRKSNMQCVFEILV